MPSLVLGPMLRYVDQACATVWVETDSPCEVTVCGATSRTFAVAGHYYALVVVTDLEPGEHRAYDVRLDGELAWPAPDSGFPPSVIRTTKPGAPYRIVVGSCRASRPDVPPYCLDKAVDKRGMGADALRALALRMLRGEPAEWPNGLLFVGDQVYADEVSPQTLEFIRARRDTSVPPYDEVADFEEYTALYREAWSEPVIRWLLSTVQSAMIFDDHDVHDDWNTSQVWRHDHQQTSWWEERIIGALSSYWLYQHLGNLAPDAIEEEGVFARLQEVDDGWPLLRDLAIRADKEADGAKGHRWSYCRDHAGFRLIVIDSRCGRVLEGDARKMVDEAEWEWIESRLQGDFDHVLVASSLPVLLPQGIQFVESWNEAVCDSAWGRRAARVGERIRQGADLEHWGAFRDSFIALLEAVAELAAGKRGKPPATVVFLSGDVHYAYLVDVHFPERYGVRSRVVQVVSSPMRNPIQRWVQRGDRFSRTAAGSWIGRTLARTAGVHDTPWSWDLVQGPWFENNVATLELHGRELAVTFECALPVAGDDPPLETVWAGELAREPLPDKVTSARREWQRSPN